MRRAHHQPSAGRRIGHCRGKEVNFFGLSGRRPFELLGQPEVEDFDLAVLVDEDV
jgi:hypothetical protein